MVYSTLTWCSLPAPPSSSQAPLFSPCVAVGILMPVPAALFLFALLLDGVYVSTRHCCRRARSISLETVSSSVSGSVNAPLNPLAEPTLADDPRSTRLLQRLGTVVSVLLMACTVVTVAVCAVLPPELPAAYLLAPVLDFAAAAACCVIAAQAAWRQRGLAWRQRGLAGLYGLVDAAACVLVVFQLPPPDSPAQDARSAYFWLAVAHVVLAAALALAMLWPYSGHGQPCALGASLSASERSEPGGRREEEAPPMLRRIASADLRRSNRNVWQEWLAYSHCSADSASHAITRDSAPSARASALAPTSATEAASAHLPTTDAPPSTVPPRGCAAGSSLPRSLGASSTPPPSPWATSLRGSPEYPRPGTTSPRNSRPASTLLPTGAGAAAAARIALAAAAPSPTAAARESSTNPFSPDYAPPLRHTTDPTASRWPGLQADRQTEPVGGSAQAAAELYRSSAPLPPNGTCDSTPGGLSSGGWGESGLGGGGSSEAALVQVEVMGHMWVPSASDATGERGAMHVEYPLVVRLGPGRPPRMVQRRFRDFDRLYEKLARHVGLDLALNPNPGPTPDPNPTPSQARGAQRPRAALVGGAHGAASAAARRHRWRVGPQGVPGQGESPQSASQSASQSAGRSVSRSVSRSVG